MPNTKQLSRRCFGNCGPPMTFSKLLTLAVTVSAARSTRTPLTLMPTASALYTRRHARSGMRCGHYAHVYQVFMRTLWHTLVQRTTCLYAVFCEDKDIHANPLWSSQGCPLAVAPRSICCMPVRVFRPRAPRQQYGRCMCRNYEACKHGNMGDVCVAIM